MRSVPFNPSGGGTDYIYYSLDRNGFDCDFEPCASFLVVFTLEAPTGGMAAGAYVLTPAGISLASSEIASRIAVRPPPSVDISAKAAMLANSSVLFLLEVKNSTLDDPAFQKAYAAVGDIAKKTSIAVSVVNGLFLSISAASALGQVGALFYLALTQPFMLLRKRREYAWGVVYDSQKKLPVDLAIVRLIDEETGRVVQTRVTDKAGRIFFFAPKGSYRIEVAKPGFAFPSAILAGEREDGKFANLYFGQRFSVAGSGQVVNPSVPLDPAGADASDKEFVKRFIRGKLRYTVSVGGIGLTAVALAISPSYMAGGLLVLNLVLFFVFRRLSFPKQPAEWGVVKDEKTGHPIAHAVVRLFSSPYNKLVETRVADGRGRYNFIVGQNVFYLTATSQGYWKTESYPLDLRGSEKPQIISAPVSLRRMSKTDLAPEQASAPQD